MAERLRVVVDGAPMPEAEARAVWERFSAHMEANPGDVRGFAELEGHVDGHVGVEDGAPTLTLRSTVPPKEPTNDRPAENDGPEIRKKGRRGGKRAKGPRGEERERGERRPGGPSQGAPAKPDDGEPKGRSEGKPKGRPRGAPSDRRAKRDGPRRDGASGDRDPHRRRSDDGERPWSRRDGDRRPIDGDAPPRRPGGVIRKEDAGTPKGVTEKRGRPRVVDAEPPRRKRKKSE